MFQWLLFNFNDLQMPFASSNGRCSRSFQREKWRLRVRHPYFTRTHSRTQTRRRTRRRSEHFLAKTTKTGGREALI